MKDDKLGELVGIYGSNRELDIYNEFLSEIRKFIKDFDNGESLTVKYSLDVMRDDLKVIIIGIIYNISTMTTIRHIQDMCLSSFGGKLKSNLSASEDHQLKTEVGIIFSRFIRTKEMYFDQFSVLRRILKKVITENPK
ncbi:MAG: hypothetical protein JO131_02850 [Gammaproteobacteria bacterium]|nr:hypothetical protein [Gammaproteobacteria bacterium]